MQPHLGVNDNLFRTSDDTILSLSNQGVSDSSLVLPTPAKHLVFRVILSYTVADRKLRQASNG